MCGIAGILESGNSDNNILQRIQTMNEKLIHRGPDDEGVAILFDGKLALGHRRLSILDLHKSAAQPMEYIDRYHIVYNGELYNYLELKQQLLAKGYVFKTASDTEIILAMFDQYREKCLTYFDGMFAFTLFDSVEQILFCARDRFGEKPFYYSYQPGKSFVFASEMKAIWASGVAKEIDDEMLFNYLNFEYLIDINNPSKTFYKNCKSLTNANYMIVDAHTCTIKNITSYYDIDYNKTDFSITEKQAEEQLHELFFDSVSKRLRSDVPVGTSLSGGIDSSLIVCTIDKLLNKTGSQLKTFSARFPGFIKDEGEYIKLVSEATNTLPFSVDITEQILYSNIEKVNYHQEEPYGTLSISAQFEVMKLARQNNVTVLLDGQGADELFAGYSRHFIYYFNALRANNKKKYHQEISEYYNLHQQNKINTPIQLDFKTRVSRKINENKSIKSVVKKAQFLAGRKDQIIEKDFFNDQYKNSFSGKFHFNSLNEALYYHIFKGDLQTLLRYADRNSMANSREVRLPFLSHQLVDFVFTLPDNFKIRSGYSKWILRQTFKDLVPQKIMNRIDKIGFEPPQYNKPFIDIESLSNKKEIENYIDLDYCNKNKLTSNQLLKIFFIEKMLLNKNN